MKSITQFLREGISDIVYHATNIGAAVKILQSDEFILTAPIGADAMVKGKTKQYFFLSTTRSKHGRYHMNNWQGVVMELDGRKLATKYKGQPIDYWGPEFRKINPTGNETEDRIFSPTPTIPKATKYIKSLHVLLPVNQAEPAKGTGFFATEAKPKGTVEADLDGAAKKRVMALWVEAKKNKIPISFYDERAAWLAQRKPMDLKTAQLALSRTAPDAFPPPKTYGRAEGKSSLYPWVELIQKPVGQPLSKKPWGGAERTKDGLGNFDVGNVFAADFSNAKHTKDAGTVLSFMRKNKMTTFKELLDWLHQKWNK
jgi:hypothetical protein